MSEVDDWLARLTEDALLVTRVTENVTCATYQPCRATILQVHGEATNRLDVYARPLTYFDEAQALVDTFPLRTRATQGFLDPKYERFTSITFELPDHVAPDGEDEAVALFESFPEGFVKEWRWGLGIHKLYRPVIDMIGRVGAGRDHVHRNRLRMSSEKTCIGEREYVLNLDHYGRIRRGLHRIQEHNQSTVLTGR